MLESPYKDKNGRIICQGDVISFYFSADYPDLTEPTEDISLTKMIDVVDYDEKEKEWLAWCRLELFGSWHAAYLRRYNNRCEVIGNISNEKDIELLKV